MKCTLARAGGAQIVINRATEDVTARIQDITQHQGVDRIIEVAFEPNFALDRAVLAHNGIIATYSSPTADSAPSLPFGAMLQNGFTIQFVLVYVMPAEAHRAAIRDITACLSAGRYHSHIGSRFRLDQVGEAHDAQDSGTVVGKILIDTAATEAV